MRGVPEKNVWYIIYLAGEMYNAAVMQYMLAACAYIAIRDTVCIAYCSRMTGSRFLNVGCGRILFR